jgi:O-antigen/teichoic acid export membrane protein
VPPPVEPLRQGRSQKFVLNVAWNWAGVAVSLIIGFVLSPYLFRKLGPEGYGIWALTFSLIEYYWLLDLGIRSSIAKFVAHHWALHEPPEISRVVSTAVTYSCIVAALMLGLVALAASRIERESALAYATPPAGPDSISSSGRSIAEATPITPPLRKCCGMMMLFIPAA